MRKEKKIDLFFSSIIVFLAVGENGRRSASMGRKTQTHKDR